MTIVPFSKVASADLIIDATYEGGQRGNSGDDPLSKLLGCGNQGGFRSVGSSRGGYALVVLFSTGDEPDWPDQLFPETGTFTYFGDNRRPGSELHRTKLGGNALLRTVFDRVHGNPPDRSHVPPFFVFTRGPKGRDKIFRGLAVPGGPRVPPTEDLVAVWRTTDGRRFQNYRATFTILNAARVSRDWLTALQERRLAPSSAPSAWTSWVQTGVYKPLLAPRTIRHRTREEQSPESAEGKAMVARIWEWFRSNPYRFEAFAARVWAMQAGSVTYTLTRPTVDGGRDAIGEYLLGPPEDPIRLDFALEAKCYEPNQNGIGVEETSRLISRLRHRQFGVLVTTSFVSRQAYEELRTDVHPVVVLSARDIINVLMAHGIGSPHDLTLWLEREFPVDADESNGLPE